MISQERLKIEVKLLLSADKKSYNIMVHRYSQQRVTLSDLEWPFHVSRAISAVAELLICIISSLFNILAFLKAFLALRRLHPFPANNRLLLNVLYSVCELTPCFVFQPLANQFPSPSAHITPTLVEEDRFIR